MFRSSKKPATPKSSPAKRPFEETQGAVVGRELQCTCGNMFMPDSNFCRRCGAKRADVLKKVRVKSPPRRGGSEVDDRLRIVCAFLRDSQTEEAVHDPVKECTRPSLYMLANGTRDCLGPTKSSRDKHQCKTVELIGEIFKDVAKMHEIKIAAAKKNLQDALEELKRRQFREVDICTKQAEEEYNQALAECQRCRDILAERERELLDALAILHAKEDELDFWLKLHAECYIPLVGGKLNAQQVEAHLNTLVPKLHEGTGLGKQWGFEDCLMGAFSPASREREQNLTERCDYNKGVFSEMDKAWTTWFAHLKAEVAKAKRGVPDRLAARDAAEQRRYQACEVVVAQKEAALRAVEKRKMEERERWALAHQRVIEQEQVVATCEYELKICEDAYEYYKSTEYAAYLWLCAQESGVYNHNDYVQTVTDLQGEVLHKVEMVQTGLSEGDVSRETITMLTVMAPSSLGRGKCLKNRRQATVNGQIGEVLDQVIQTKKRRVAAAHAALAAAKTTRKIERASELEVDRRKYDDACERCRMARAEVAAATAERDQAQSEVDHLRMTLESWQDVYDHHFVPLRDGPGVPKADSHLAALRPLFQQWGEPYEFEECLLGGFYPAAHETPDQRHSWCKKVLAEVDS